MVPLKDFDCALEVLEQFVLIFTMEEDVICNDFASAVLDLFFFGELFPLGLELLHHRCKKWKDILDSHGHPGESFLSVGHLEGCFAFGSFRKVNMPMSAIHVAGDKAIGISNFENGIVASGCGEGEGVSFGIQRAVGCTELEDVFGPVDVALVWFSR